MLSSSLTRSPIDGMLNLRPGNRRKAEGNREVEEVAIMKIIVHGAAREVGRSCIEVITENRKRFLLDAGVKLSEHGTEFPTAIENPSEMAAVFLSHAHLDHNGYLPMLDHQGMKCPIFATEATKELTKIILEDAFKIGRLKHEH